MNIFACTNYAGVPMVLKKYQRRLFGHSITIVDDALINREDTTNYYEYDNEIIKDKTRNLLWSLCTKYAKERYDLYHLHGLPMQNCAVRKFRLWKKNLVADFIRDTPAILHLHGYESKLFGEADWKTYRAVLCSTPDLWKPGMTYLPNPVDIEMWSYREHKGNKALWMKQWDVDDPPWNEAERIVRRRAKELGFDLTVYERRKGLRSYMSMPQFYHNWDILIEYKPGSNYEPNKFGEPAVGLSALECMVSGLKVYFLHDDKYLHWDDFRHHDANNVARELERVYVQVTS